MIHDAAGLCLGNASDMREMLDLLDRASDNIASIYAERSGIADVDHWRKLMSAETWFSAREAVGAGLADEVDGDEATVPEANWDLSVFAHAGRQHAPSPVVVPMPILTEVEQAELAAVLPTTDDTPSQWDFGQFMRGLTHGS
jgi:hypothetical protein